MPSCRTIVEWVSTPDSLGRSGMMNCALPQSRGTLIFLPDPPGDRRRDGGGVTAYPRNVLWLAGIADMRMGDAMVENVGETEVKSRRSCKLAHVHVAFSRSRTKTINAFPVETATAALPENWNAERKIYANLAFSEISALYKTHLSYSTKTPLKNS